MQQASREIFLLRAGQCLTHAGARYASLFLAAWIILRHSDPAELGLISSLFFLCLSMSTILIPTVTRRGRLLGKLLAAELALGACMLGMLAWTLGHDYRRDIFIVAIAIIAVSTALIENSTTILIKRWSTNASLPAAIGSGSVNKAAAALLSVLLVVVVPLDSGRLAVAFTYVLFLALGVALFTLVTISRAGSHSSPHSSQRRIGVGLLLRLMRRRSILKADSAFCATLCLSAYAVSQVLTVHIPNKAARDGSLDSLEMAFYLIAFFLGSALAFCALRVTTLRHAQLLNITICLIIVTLISPWVKVVDRSDFFLIITVATAYSATFLSGLLMAKRLVVLNDPLRPAAVAFARFLVLLASSAGAFIGGVVAAANDVAIYTALEALACALMAAPLLPLINQGSRAEDNPAGKVYA